jgi:hypothetical protein
MARAFKDELAFNNFERDIKKIKREEAREEADTRISLSMYKREVMEHLCTRLKLRETSVQVQKILKSADQYINDKYKFLESPKQVAREIETKFEVTDWGFSHHKAGNWVNK